MDETQRYLRATLRATVWLVGVLLAIVLQTGAWWALFPFVAGVGFSVILLLVWDRTIRALVALYRALRQSGGEKTLVARRAQRLFVGVALVKYPLVAVLLWALTRIWDARSLALFAAGFALLHAVIGARAFGKALTEKTTPFTGNKDRIGV